MQKIEFNFFIFFINYNFRKMPCLKFLNEYFTTFIVNKGGEDLKKMWLSKDNQDELKKVYKKKRDKIPKRETQGPKRNLNAMILFSNEQRKKDLAEGIKRKDAFKYYAELWREVKEKDIETYKRFKDLSDKEKLKYQREKNKNLPKEIVNCGFTYVLKETDEENEDDVDDDSSSSSASSSKN
jgi:hypothetical protein